MSVDVGEAVGYLDLDTSGFQNGFQTALSGLKAFEDKSATIGEKLGSLGGVLSGVGKSMSTYLTVPILGAGVAAMKVGNDFEKQMSRVQGISGATKDELASLTDQAIRLGADTSFSASEAATGMENLASAGFTTNEIMSAMPGLLDLAASSGTDLATASDIAASAVRGFGLQASDTTHVADIFAQVAASTNAQTEDMGDAMKYVAPVAAAMGQSIEETAAAIGIMANAGIKGSQAGTTLRGALSSLAKPTDEMKEKMEELSLDFFDAQGNMLPLNGIIGELQTSFEGLTQEQQNNALVTLFGQESLSGMLTLVQAGPDELVSMTDSLENCSGAASDMADVMLNNTSGAIEQLKGSIETLGIKLQQALAPQFTKIINGITDFVNSLSSMDDETLQVIITIAGIVAAVGPLLLIGGKILTSISGVISAFTAISAAATAAGVGVASLLGPIALVIAAVVALVAAFATNFGGIRDETTAILGDIQTVITTWLSAITEAWNTDFLGIRTIISEAWSDIEKIFSDALQIIQDVFDVFSALLTGDWDKFGQSLLNLWNDIWKSIYDVIGAVFNLIVNLLISIMANLSKALEKAVYDLVNGFITKWNEFIDWWKVAVTDPVKFWNNIGTAMYDAGASVFNSLWEGALSVWNDIVNWVNGAVDWITSKVQFWKEQSSQVSSGGGAGRSSKSHASGLDYVPYDGYQATLHQGERVLTAQENKQGSSGGIKTVVLQVPLVIDGRQFAYAEAKYIDEELR